MTYPLDCQQLSVVPLSVLPMGAVLLGSQKCKCKNCSGGTQVSQSMPQVRLDPLGRSNPASPAPGPWLLKTTELTLCHSSFLNSGLDQSSICQPCFWTILLLGSSSMGKRHSRSSHIEQAFAWTLRISP